MLNALRHLRFNHSHKSLFLDFKNRNAQRLTASKVQSHFIEKVGDQLRRYAQRLTASKVQSHGRLGG